MPRRSRSLPLIAAALVAAALVAGACGDTDGPRVTREPTDDSLASSLDPSSSSSQPTPADPVDTAASEAFLAAACAGDTAVTDQGTLPPDLNEISGLTASRAHDGVLWAVEDSLEPPDLIAIDAATGAVLGTVVLEGEGVANVDWEDLAAGPGPDGEPWLYVADIGDNFAVRPQVAILALPEPEPVDGRAQAELALATYDGGSTNAEAMVVTTGGTWVIGKVQGPAPLYRLDEATQTFEATGTTLDVGDELVTGASVSPDGALLAVRTYQEVLLFPLGSDGDVAAAIADEEPCPTTPPDEPGGETVALLPEGEGLVTISEAPEGQAAVNLTQATQ
jgi:hypothetical protein